jgi:hypothetical protein
VIDARADDDIEPRDAEAFAATDRACREVGWVFQRTGGPDLTFAANVRWLAGDPVAVLPALYHLMWRHELVTELRKGLLGPGGTVVTRQEGTVR